MADANPGVRVEWLDGVGVIRLSRPDLRNPLTGEPTIRELLTLLGTAEADRSIRALVLTGDGTTFSAGGNVEDMTNRREMFEGPPHITVEAYRRLIQRLVRRLEATDLVLIAAVNGPAVGAGFDLATLCDLRLAGESAWFAATFVDLGLVPGDGGAWFLLRAVGPQRATELLTTGRRMGAREALETGYVLEVVPDDELLNRALTMAGDIASKPSHAIRLVKRMMRHARTSDLDTYLELSAAYQAIAHDGPEHAAWIASRKDR